MKNYNKSEITFPSCDGVHTIHAEIYAPKTKTAKGIVQLLHGMQDYVARYEELADFLTAEGYIFAGHHHLGHGKSAGCDEDYGFFADNGGAKLLVDDAYEFNKILHNEHPTLPVVMMGHSMGSFVARLYVREYPLSVRGVIIHGTGGPNPVLPMGKAIAKLIKGIKGARHRSNRIDNLAFGAYNSRFPKQEGKHAWLTREVNLVAGRDDDPYQNFKFTVSAFIDLFTMLGECNKREWFSEYPKELPTLIISGDADPVGNYGKGPDYVYKQLLIAGCDKVSAKSYEGARHELFNETNRKEVFSDLLDWIKKIN